ncbi:hypothetical protein Poli38472_000501 [Pythium oligandrum]|uniref:M96 mating-specific protein family n=1 Tax=Pythium oligandrum TaxID=41045 RepID=A0A8K1CBR6_PYTOL|nr:hypothetical protein Poli38472_000501 [Pythium oligandrum]|eukprot:TMW60459.1 hypothetical protein Poli38472_000501 [Pythium oligandrum]
MTEDAEMFEAMARLLDVPVDAQATTDVLMHLLDDDDDCGVSSAHQAPVSTTASQPEKRKRRPGYNSNKARDARKHELVQLRSTVAQLECVATQLRQQHEKRSKSTRSQDLMVRRSVWRPIAARQLEERRRAEETNTQLRIQLADQTKLTESLQRIVTRPSVTQGFIRCGILVPRRGYVPPTYQYDPSMHKEMLHEVEANYNEVDALFRRLNLNDEEEQSGDLHVRRNDKAGRFESHQLEILPVSAHVAADIVWQHYAEHMSSVPFRRYYERTTAAGDLTEDTIIERICVELQSSETITTSTQELQVMRRYTEKDRIVIVWYCTMRPVLYANQEVNPLDSLERGYMVFEPSKTLDPESHSVLKMCVTHKRYDEVADLDGVQRKAVESMVSHGITMASALHRSIENMVLERRTPRSPTKHETKQKVVGVSARFVECSDFE